MYFVRRQDRRGHGVKCHPSDHTNLDVMGFIKNGNSSNTICTWEQSTWMSSGLGYVV